MLTSYRLSFCLAICFFAQISFAQNYVFFLHNRFLEEHKEGAYSKKYDCHIEYTQILDSLRKADLIVISEIRPKDTDARKYSQKVVKQIDSLLQKGIQGEQITVVGTSKGGYIAQYVSNALQNKAMNFVFIGSCSGNNPDVKFYGNVLSIYENSDSIGRSCAIMKEKSEGINEYQEIMLDTGLQHGFLYRALPAWLQPTIAWAKQKHLKK